MLDGAQYVEGKSKNDLLHEMVGTAQPGSVRHEQQKMAIIVRSIEDLELKLGNLTQAIADSNVSSAELSKKVYGLNFSVTVATWIGGIATVVGTLIALIGLYHGAR